jgi:orotate phosphoribosyltransferase
MTLFQLGNFTLASGKESDWKIECDALTVQDWEALAKMAAEILPAFSEVQGVPTGAIPFADALMKYRQQTGPLLIAEDVVTTGGSMERFREGRDAIGIAVFSRGNHPDWVTPLFVMTNPSI